MTARQRHTCSTKLFFHPTAPAAYNQPVSWHLQRKPQNAFKLDKPGTLRTCPASLHLADELVCPSLALFLCLIPCMSSVIWTFRVPNLLRRPGPTSPSPKKLSCLGSHVLVLVPWLSRMESETHLARRAMLLRNADSSEQAERFVEKQHNSAMEQASVHAARAPAGSLAVCHHS